jgi:hypothetical protein
MFLCPPEMWVKSLAFLRVGGVMPGHEDARERSFPPNSDTFPPGKQVPEFIPAKRLGADAPVRLHSGDELFRGGHGRAVVVGDGLGIV